MKRRFLLALLAALLVGCNSTSTTNTDEPVLKEDPIVATDAVGFGWIKDADAKKAPRYASIRTIAAGDIPPTMDLRAEMSPVENQGPINSCVANAIVGALEFLQIRNGIPKNKRFLDMSRMFLYYKAREAAGLQTVDRGCYISHGILVTTDLGMVTEKRWPYTYSRLYRKPPRAIVNVARKKLVRDYYYIWGDDMTSENPNPSVENVKAALAEGYPVVFGTTVFSSFMAVGKDGMVPVPNLATERAMGGHAMLMVGYTQTHFIVRNSWGAGWGDSGYCYIPFGYFKINGTYNPTFDFWVLRLQTNLFTKEMEQP
jgi:C1A family cysteine protease